jgi:tryprostatin B 6-hydroxylase
MATTLTALLPITSPTQVAVAAAAGVLSHLLYFVRGEHHNNGITIIIFYLSLLPCLTSALYHYGDISLLLSAAKALLLATSYFAGLYGSITVYRGVFHPLRKFDGPFWGKFSNLYHSWLLVERSDNYRLMTKLHHKYGDIVRTGKSRHYS